MSCVQGQSIGAAVGVGVVTSNSTFTSGPVSVAAKATFIGAVGHEANVAVPADADTVNGAWSAQKSAVADSTVTGTSISVQSQYKTPTACWQSDVERQLWRRP